jgi:hypothetical protein
VELLPTQFKKETLPSTPFAAFVVTVLGPPIGTVVIPRWTVKIPTTNVIAVTFIVRVSVVDVPWVAVIVPTPDNATVCNARENQVPVAATPPYASIVSNKFGPAANDVDPDAVLDTVKETGCIMVIAAELKVTTQKLAVTVAAGAAPVVAVTVVAFVSATFGDIVLILLAPLADVNPSKKIAELAVGALVIVFVPLVAAAATVTVPYWTELTRLDEPSIITALTVMVMVVSETPRVAVMVVLLVNVRYAQFLPKLAAVSFVVWPCQMMKAPEPTALIVAVAVVAPVGIVMLTCWMPPEFK